MNTSQLNSDPEWIRVDDPTGYDFSDVKAIAVDFDAKKFNSGNTADKSASIDIVMHAPDEDVGIPDNVMAYSQLAFTDIHSSVNVPVTTITNNVAIKLLVAVDSPFELPKTGGPGTGSYIILGSTTALLAALLLADRKKRR